MLSSIFSKSNPSIRGRASNSCASSDKIPIKCSDCIDIFYAKVLGKTVILSVYVLLTSGYVSVSEQLLEKLIIGSDDDIP